MPPFDPLGSADDNENAFFQADIDSSPDAGPVETAHEREPAGGHEEAPETDDRPEVEVETPEDGDDETEGEESHRVPLAELKRERQRRQDFERQLRDQEARYQRLQDRTERLLGRFEEVQRAKTQPQEQPKKDEPPEPDRNSDPLGWMQYKIEQFERMNMTRAEQEAKMRQQYEAEQQNQQVFQKFYDTLQTVEDGFRETHQDYDAAVNHLAATRDHELAMYGYTPQQRQQIITQEFVQTSAQLMQAGRNPAEIFYNAARQKGYDAKQASPAPQQPKKTVKELAQTRKRTAAPSGGGPAEREVVTAEALTDMSDEDFDRYFLQVYKGT